VAERLEPALYGGVSLPTILAFPKAHAEQTALAFANCRHAVIWYRRPPQIYRPVVGAIAVYVIDFALVGRGGPVENQSNNAMDLHS